MTTTTKGKTGVKAKRRFIALFSLSFPIALYIMVQAAYVVSTPWYIDAFFVVGISTAFSIGLGLLGAMRLEQMKGSLGVYVAGAGIVLAITIQLHDEAMYWHSFMLMSIMFFIGGILAKDKLESYE
ncbi:hypothetical protein [Bacillus thuringiensis]|uniref:Uncharacterized protein n=1 Tax=Bacillus thuringiensis TaxID=1428 RepID=A0A9X6ZPP7_BACTU|nr:hypothetical protein [Bacillus thuringiensis]PFJ25021.1 hypothetical protein COJ15_36045 [Bacillus thuringiensis]